MSSFRILLLPGRFEIHRFAAETDWKRFDLSSVFFCIVGTSEELSVVTEEGRLISSRSEKGWRCLKLEGPFSFGTTGVIASLSTCLADARIPIFAVSTFDTDYLLLKEEYVDAAKRVLAASGHQPLW